MTLKVYDAVGSFDMDFSHRLRLRSSNSSQYLGLGRIFRFVLKKLLNSYMSTGDPKKQGLFMDLFFYFILVKAGL